MGNSRKEGISKEMPAKKIDFFVVRMLLARKKSGNIEEAIMRALMSFIRV